MAPTREHEYCAAYVAGLERDIEELRTELALLDVGHTGTCGPATGYNWVDTTEENKAWVRNAIADLAAAIMDFRHDTGFAGA